MHSMNDSDKILNGFRDSYKEHLSSFNLPDKLSGIYTYKNCLKQSSHKTIYLLSDKKENLFILKKETGHQLSQLKQEAHIFELLNRVEHISTPKYIDYWEENHTGYLLRTYVNGISLADYYERRLFLTDQEIIDYMLEICYLIQVLHTQEPPIIHRDIKPENFVIERGTGILYLVDFDTARQYTPDKSRDTHLIGTPSHAAPEQFGFSQSDVRTDIYAIGKTLLYLSCGGTEETEVQTSVLSKSLKKIITRCTSFTPANRYSNIKQLIRALKHYRNRLTGFPIHRRQPAVSIFLLVFGIFLGYHMGTTGHKQFPSFDANNIISNNTDTGNLDKTPSSTETVRTKYDISGTGTSPSSSGNLSLLEQSGTLECDILQFQELLNQVILDYYKNDAEAMAYTCEKLVEAIYQDPAITQISGTDYTGYNEIPAGADCPPVTMIRDLLIYRNEMLNQNLNTYIKYKDYIYFEMSTHLDPTIADTSNALYGYSTQTGDEAMENYPYALIDILRNIVRGIDRASGIEKTPF